MKANDISKIA